MLTYSAIFKVSICGTAVIALTGCQVMKNPFSATSAAQASNKSLVSSASNSLPSLADSQPPPNPQTATEIVVPSGNVQMSSNESELSIPNENLASTIDEYQSQDYSFDRPVSTGYSSRSRSKSSSCSSGCCSH